LTDAVLIPPVVKAPSRCQSLVRALVLTLATSLVGDVVWAADDVGAVTCRVNHEGIDGVPCSCVNGNLVVNNVAGGGGCGPNADWTCPNTVPGLAGWRITEPTVNLWLMDTPLMYPASRGRSVRFRLIYKNRLGEKGNGDAAEPGIFSLGARWTSP